MKQDSAGGRLVENLRAHGGHGERLRSASLEKSRTYRAGTRRHCSQAKLVFHSFPVFVIADPTEDRMRLREARALPWPAERREKLFSLAEESGGSHRASGRTA